MGRKIKDLTGKKFGKLTVLYPTDKRRGTFVVWHCKCDCGNECDVSSHDIQSSNTTSCGCVNSKGEMKISKIFNENNIQFEQQKTFNSCRFNDTNALARFDFFVDDKYIIEYDGVQHFKYANSGWNTKENFEKTKECDNYKNQWCRENNIPLIRIPYTALDTLTINDLKLETSKYLIL